MPRKNEGEAENARDSEREGELRRKSSSIRTARPERFLVAAGGRAGDYFSSKVTSGLTRRACARIPAFSVSFGALAYRARSFFSFSLRERRRRISRVRST